MLDSAGPLTLRSVRTMILFFKQGNYLFVREYDQSLTVLNTSDSDAPEVAQVLSSHFAQQETFSLNDELYLLISL